MRYNRRNAARDDLINADRHMSELFAVWDGIYNGQFTEGPAASNPHPDGWELYPNGANTIVRTNADATAGSHSILGTCVVGATWVGQMNQQKLMPVSVLTTYNVYVSTNASGAAIQCRWGMMCYNTVKANIGLAIAYGPAAPGAGWVETVQQMGAAGTGFVATTRYVRFFFDWTDTTGGSSIYVDNVFITR